MVFVHKQSQKWRAKITDTLKQKYIGVYMSHNRTLSLRAHHKIVASEINAVLRGQNPKFDSRLARVGFVVDDVALRQVFFQVLRFTLLISFYQVSVLSLKISVI
jgi:hypothetical protein